LILTVFFIFIFMNKTKAIFLVIAIVAFVKFIKFVNLETVSGKVIDQSVHSLRSRTGSFTQFYYPIVKFEFEGKNYTTTPVESMTFYDNHDIGNSCNVIFEKEKPQEAKVYTVFSYWLNFPTVALIAVFYFDFDIYY
jgi:hypothetical protein